MRQFLLVVALAVFASSSCKGEDDGRDGVCDPALGDECACVGSLTNHFPDGSSFEVNGVFVYRVNDAGKLLSLRTYWEYEQGVFTKAASD